MEETKLMIERMFAAEKEKVELKLWLQELLWDKFSSALDLDMEVDSPDYIAPASPDYIPPTDANLLSEEQSNGSSKYQCSKCFAQFDLLLQVNEHLMEIHYIDGLKEDDLKSFVIEPTVAMYSSTEKSAALNLLPNEDSEYYEAIYECNLCKIRIKEKFEMFEHLEENHEAEEDEEGLELLCSLLKVPILAAGILQSPVSSIPAAKSPKFSVSPVYQTDKSSPTVDSDSSDEGLTYGDDSVEETNIDNQPLPETTETSNSTSSSTEAESPPLVSTMQEVKDYMNSNAELKFLISDELSKTEEFCKYMDSKKNEKNETTPDEHLIG